MFVLPDPFTADQAQPLKGEVFASEDAPEGPRVFAEQREPEGKGR